MPLRHIIALLVAVGAIGLGLRGEEAMPASKPAVRKQIVAAIDGQLTAFRKHDLARAYRYAAAALRAEKPLPIFAAIVQANYPEIWTNTRAEYGIVHDDGATATVLVHVFAPDTDASYDYALVSEGGSWKVHDVLRHDPASSDKM